MLVLSSFSVKGQEYHKLINETMYWDIAYAEMGYVCTGFSNIPPKRFSFSGDTIIQGKIYSKSFYRELTPTNFTPPPYCSPFVVDTNTNLFTSFFLREDTIEKKVWRYSSSSGVEELLFDFSLQQGDTLYHQTIVEPTIIDTVYEITTSDDVVRKKFVLATNYGYDYYIEGIGGVAGLFMEPFHYFESGDWLMCVKDSYDMSIFDVNGMCFDFITNVFDSDNFTQCKIYPNPFSKYITIESSYESLEILILNKYGQELYSKKLSSGNKIDFSNLDHGIYIIKVLNDNQIIHVEKIMKMNGL